jgi:hypothetical protein
VQLEIDSDTRKIHERHVGAFAEDAPGDFADDHYPTFDGGDFCNVIFSLHVTIATVQV